MSPHDWFTIVDSVGTTIFLCTLVFCFFGGIGATERIIRERATRKDRRRREDREDWEKTLRRAEEIIAKQKTRRVGSLRLNDPVVVPDD